MIPGHARTGIALVGDYNPEIVAHRAINQCFALARKSIPDMGEPRWLATEAIASGDESAFQGFSGVWCVPGSPYRNTEGALWAIHYARTHALPFLGTCGGYQHALLEYARNVLGLKNAGHSELDEASPLPLLHRMRCSLIEKSQKVVVTNNEFRRIYGAESGEECFHCSFGLNPAYEHLFSGTPLEIVARSAEGEARAFRLKGHPFFVGAQFQPERRALAGSIHPLVQAFLSASPPRRA